MIWYYGDIMVRKYNFHEFESSPQTIGELLAKCNKLTHIKDLKKYPISDINKLVEIGELIANNDYYRLRNSENNKLVNEYKLLSTQLFPITKLKRNIIQFKIAWEDFSNLITSIIKEKQSISIAIQVSESEIIKIEHYISNFLSSISKIRDGMKKTILAVVKDGDKEKVTNTLIDDYAEYQEKYDDLLKQTINLPIIEGLNNYLRNRILHGGDMLFNVCWINIPTNGQFITYPTALCDYEMLESSKSIENYRQVKKNLFRYYHDESVMLLTLILNKKITIDFLAKDMLDRLNSDLQLRTNDKNINIRTLHHEKIKEYLEDKDFILFMYRVWAQRKIPSHGQFAFDLSAALGMIYNLHLRYYSTLYSWLVTKKNHEIKSLISLHNELKKLAPEFITVDENLSFSLNA